MNFVYFKNIALSLMLFFAFSSYVSAEIIKIKCKTLDAGMDSGSSTYLFDLTNQRVKIDHENSSWFETLHWDDKYIVVIHGKSMMGGDVFRQSAMIVLERDSMLLLGTTFISQDFRRLRNNKKHKPLSFTQSCVRGF